MKEEKSNVSAPQRAKVKKNPKAAIAKIKKTLYTICVVILVLICLKNELVSWLQQNAADGSAAEPAQQVQLQQGGEGNSSQISVQTQAAPEIEYRLAGSAASKEQDANGNIIDHSNLLISVKNPKDVMPKGFSLNDVPEYTGNKYYVVNGNIPFFTQAEISLAKKGAFEYYGPLDSYGRCTVAFDCLGKETMPASGQKRGSISKIYPSGWKQARYDCVDSETVMTRAHLAGFMLSSENANEKNLVTGTRYMNSDAMLYYEEATQDYLYHNRTKHVLYRVTPIFKGSELMPRGVLMEAQSVEDNGYAVQYCVYIYNVQPGLSFDYQTGRSSYTGIFLDSDSGTVEIDDINTGNYGLDISTGTIHNVFCKEFAKVPASDRIGFVGDTSCVSTWPQFGYRLCSCLK